MKTIKVTDATFLLLETLRQKCDGDYNEVIWSLYKQRPMKIESLNLTKSISVCADQYCRIPTLVVSPEDYERLQQGTTARLSYDYDVDTNFFYGKSPKEIEFRL